MFMLNANFVQIGIFVALIALLHLARTWNRPPLPPGPHGRYPFLGMTFDMPRERPWQACADWAKYDLSAESFELIDEVLTLK